MMITQNIIEARNLLQAYSSISANTVTKRHLNQQKNTCSELRIKCTNLAHLIPLVSFYTP